MPTIEICCDYNRKYLMPTIKNIQCLQQKIFIAYNKKYLMPTIKNI